MSKVSSRNFSKSTHESLSGKIASRFIFIATQIFEKFQAFHKTHIYINNNSVDCYNSQLNNTFFQYMISAFL